MTTTPSLPVRIWRPARAATALALAAALTACDPDHTAPLEPEAPAAAVAPGGQWSAWSEPVAVAGVNTQALEQRPALSRDALSLYFMSNRKGGLGGTDLWVARRACLDCSWEAPVNLGAAVNTAGNDAAPALSRDEHWLFFNSNRPDGLGGADLWASYRSDVHDDLAWQPPVNLGPGVNSRAGESQASFFENEGGRAQLFFARAGSIHMSEMLPDGTWGPAAVVDALAAFNGPSIHPNGREIYVFELFKDHRIWRATREGPDAPWSSPVELTELTPGVASVFHPFIHARGGTETLWLAAIPSEGAPPDLYAATRTR